jgi:hypothetical protein
MITMAAGKPPRTGVDSPIDILGPSGTQTFYTQVGPHARSLSPLGGQTKAYTIHVSLPDIYSNEPVWEATPLGKA